MTTASAATTAVSLGRGMRLRSESPDTDKAQQEQGGLPVSEFDRHDSGLSIPVGAG